MAVLEPTAEAGSVLPTPDGVEEGSVVHSHHYNVGLVRTILEVSGIDAHALLSRAAEELTWQRLRARWEAEGWRSSERCLEDAVELFRVTGLGDLTLDEVTHDGGTARLGRSHFALGWRDRFGRAARPVCSVPAGQLAGALGAAYDRRYDVVETGCAAQSDLICTFRVRPAESAEPLPDQGARYRTHLPFPAPVAPAIDEAAVISALGTVVGSAIPGFVGGTTQLWTELYTSIARAFETQVPRALGGKYAKLPSLLLLEASHTNAFYTFGGIMRSEAWRTRVAPLLRSREEWLHAVLAIINTLGWGAWRVHALVPHERATIRVYHGYEADSYRSLFDRAETPRCFLARGTVTALMNLLYVGDIAEAPALDPSYYNRLFRSPLSFRTVETRCRASDDPFCEFIANPLSPSLGAILGDG